MLNLILACVGTSVWVPQPQVIGPHFGDEVRQIHAAVVERVRRVPGVCVIDYAPFEQLVAARRTRAKGPVCAAAPNLHDLVELRARAEAVGGVLADSRLTFSVGELSFVVISKDYGAKAWVAAIAASEGTPGGGGGGGMGIGYAGEPMGASIWPGRRWLERPQEHAYNAALAERLRPCRDEGAARDRATSIHYEVVIEVDDAGAVTRAEHLEAEGAPRARQCVVDAVKAVKLPPGEAGRRALDYIVDRAPAPLARGEGLWRFRLTTPPTLINTTPLYEASAITACPVPMDDTPFELTVDATGQVTKASVASLKGEARACLEQALAQVRFPCPERGATTLRGEISREE